MYSKTIVRKNAYFDSVTLMSLGSKIKKLPGVDEAVVVMATEMNREILEHVGLGNEETQNAGANDLVIAVRCSDEETYQSVFQEIEDRLSGSKEKAGKTEKEYKTIKQAIDDGVPANVAVISVPGRYAAREARKALEKGLHVMLFSDNVSIEKERELKELAAEKGLLVMGPDCGTAVINGTGICFANKIREGGIGIVGASGTGLQEVMVQIDRLGGGISQAIGTGGRDLKEEIGGIMMLEGIKALEKEPSVKVITLVSKPPEESVEEKIRELLSKGKKPVVVCFLEGKHKEFIRENVYFTDTLLETARLAVRLEKGEEAESDEEEQIPEETAALAQKDAGKLREEQKFVRGLFCGGTLCAEALIVLRQRLGLVRSNISHHQAEQLGDLDKPEGNRLLDLGEDLFTNGRPHPMIEPSLRNDWIVREAEDKTTGVILMDLEIGYGSHEDPAGVTLEGIQQARETAEKDGRSIAFVGYICGTGKDKQDLEQQKQILRDEGVILADSNVAAAEIAAYILNRKDNQKGGEENV